MPFSGRSLKDQTSFLMEKTEGAALASRVLQSGFTGVNER
jgi:hypothetical protein